MSITKTYMHTLEPGMEQYAFRSELNPKQKHFIDRDDDEPWKLGLVQLETSLSITEVQDLIQELEALHAFMTNLQERQIRRSTEPGEPDHSGIGGGL